MSKVEITSHYTHFVNTVPEVNRIPYQLNKYQNGENRKEVARRI